MNTDQMIYVAQGEFHTSDRPEVVFSTVLGSCVSACLWDPARGVGGMNHFLLAKTTDANAAGSLRYGVHAMEMLINDLLKKGAKRSDLRAKLFGGADMAANLGEIGTKNAQFAKTFLATEEIPCLAESLGGKSARRVLFRPCGGLARQLIVESESNTEHLAQSVAPRPQSQAILF